MVQGSFPSCGAAPCCKGWSDCWDWIQILPKSRQGSLHELMCIRPTLGGEEAFLSTTNCRHKKSCLGESKPGRNTSKDLSVKISDCINKRCLWKKLGALPTPQGLSSPVLIDALPLPAPGRLPPSSVTQFPHLVKL